MLKDATPKHACCFSLAPHTSPGCHIGWMGQRTLCGESRVCSLLRLGGPAGTRSGDFTSAQLAESRAQAEMPREGLLGSGNWVGGSKGSLHSLGAQQGAASPQCGERPHQRAKAENQRFWRKWLVREGEMEGEREIQGGGLIYPAHGCRAPS